MSQSFEIPVTYNGKTLSFPAELLQTGYTHKFRVEVYGQELFFEPDEEQNYRTIIDPNASGKEIPVDLIKTIAEAIEAILK